MSDRGRSRSSRLSQSSPVRLDGIAVDRFGASWWGREWLASLERLGGSWPGRLAGGRSFARQGRVSDLGVGVGLVSATVLGTQEESYCVEVRLPALDEAQWHRGVDRIAEDLVLMLRLLQRELPGSTGESLKRVGIDLFPSSSELSNRCSCEDQMVPCKHVSAVHYLFAAAIDNDPFLLFRLRGMERDRLVALLVGEDDTNVKSVRAEAVALESLEAAEGVSVADFFDPNRPIPAIEINPSKPRAALVAVRRLGPPPRRLEGLPELLAPMIRAGADAAHRLLWEESCEEDFESIASGPSGETSRPKQAASKEFERQVESLLTQAGRPLLKREIIEGVRAERSEVDRAIRRLRAASLVRVQGKGSGTRYVLNERAAPGHMRHGRGEQEELADRVCETLAASRKALSMRALADRLGVDIPTLRPVVTSLRQNGVVEKTGYRRSARYRLKK